MDQFAQSCQMAWAAMVATMESAPVSIDLAILAAAVAALLELDRRRFYRHHESQPTAARPRLVLAIGLLEAAVGLVSAGAIFCSGIGALHGHVG